MNICNVVYILSSAHSKIYLFLGEMQRITFTYCYRRVCVSVCMPRLWTPGKWFQIAMSVLVLNCAE